MLKKDPKLSIIYVNYRSEEDLLNSIKSIKNAKTRYSYEIIVVDNSKSSKLKQNIKKLMPKVFYIKSSYNLGYGAGNNLGSIKSKGKYLLFLNPDTIVQKNAIDKLTLFLDRKKDAAAVSPNLYHANDKIFSQFGTEILTPVKALFTQTFVEKLAPFNPISRRYWLKNLKKSRIRKVGTLPGSAFMIKKEIFRKIGGFDENIFMYFEEQDLGIRIKNIGKKLYIIPSAKIIHKKNKKLSKNLGIIYKKSRKYYFKKHYGNIWAAIIDYLSKISLGDFTAFLIFLFALFLRFYKIRDILIFNGELGNYYLEIKNYIRGSSLPLKGPQTSHPWLSFGPLYYWMVIPLFLIFGYDPKVPAYFMAFIGALGVLMNYIFVKKLFDKKIALLSSYFIAIAYPFLQLSLSSMFFGIVVPLFYPFLYFLVRSVKENPKYLIHTSFFLGLLLNFHLTPLILIPGVIIYLYFYKFKKTFGILIKSFTAFVIPQIPLLIYDAKQGFEMTKNISLWIPYRIAGFFGFYPKNNATSDVLKSNIASFSDYFVKTLIGENRSLFLAALLFSILVFYYFVKVCLKDKEKYKAEVAVLTLLIIGYIAIFLHGDPPYHYYLPIYTLPSIIYAYFLIKYFKSKSKFWIGLIIALFSINMLYYYFSDNWFYKNKYLIDKNGYVPYLIQNHISKKIIFESQGYNFELSRVGNDDQFERNYAQNYQYLLWLMGNEPVAVGGVEITREKPAIFRFIIYEDKNRLNPNPFNDLFWEGDVLIEKIDYEI